MTCGSTRLFIFATIRPSSAACSGPICAANRVRSRFASAGDAPPVAIYFNGSCHDCVPYLDHELVPLLRRLGVGEIGRYDYIQERRFRRELVERSQALGRATEMLHDCVGLFRLPPDAAAPATVSIRLDGHQD